jgi:sensor histidine kinase YesM
MSDSSNTQTGLKSVLETLRDSTVLAVCLSIMVALGGRGSFRNFQYFLAEIWIYTTLIMVLAWQVFPRLAPYVQDRDALVQWTVFVVTAILISAAGSAVGSVVVHVLFESGIPITTLFIRSFTVAAVLTVVIGVNEVAFDRLRGQLESTKLRLRTEELERERALKLATEARLASLEARLHPHFLFNTLNSISSLIPVDPVRAERLVERMAALLRFSFEAHRGGVVPLEQEMKIVRDYLEIEQARFGPRLRYSLDAADTLAELQVPPLSIQTLVENSIKYAVAPSRDGGEIRVRAGRNNGLLRIDVFDTGPGFDLQDVPEGHGLDNLRGRLTALFGDTAELTTARSDGRTVVSMQLPA